MPANLTIASYRRRQFVTIYIVLKIKGHQIELNFRPKKKINKIKNIPNLFIYFFKKKLELVFTKVVNLIISICQ